jgi:hypothetical protein
MEQKQGSHKQTLPRRTIPSVNGKTKKKKIKLKVVSSIHQHPQIPTPSPKVVSQIFKNRDQIQECKEEDIKKVELNDKRKELTQKKKECEQELYGYIFKYFSTNETLEDLLVALYKMYKERKDKDIMFKLTLREFIMLFPRDSTVNDYNFKRQHVFEQICRLLLLFNYDNVYGNKKVFYLSLEDYSKGKTNKLTKNDILNLKINDGSLAQSVDIFFKIPGTIKKDLTSEQLCGKTRTSNQITIQPNPTTQIKDKYILIQNKFYDSEYSSADKYDVTKIAHRAVPLTTDRFNNSTYEIVLMVNSKKSLDEKIKRNRNDDFGLVSNIFGLDELENWFQNMLFDLYKSPTIEDFIKREKNDKPTLQLRFHQELIVNTSNTYLNLDGKYARKKFIWGCVPRSGKSYMVAGMVEKRKHLNNDILIILGAKSETETQFVEMFTMYDNFSEYGIIRTHTDLVNEKRKGKDKFIFILSQEKIKVNKDIEFTDKFKQDYEELFTKKQIDLYFDEIHKGGSTETSQHKLIQSLLDEDFHIDLFVMVTATYARPTIAYEQLVTKYPPVIINWSYNDQQIMKEITNLDKLNQFKLSRNNDIEIEMIDNLLDEYKIRFGEDYLNILEDYYKNYPELVIINPFIDIDPHNDKLFNLHGNVFRLRCNAIGKTIDELKEPTNIFEDNNAVVDLLNFIARISPDNTLSPDCIYGQLKYGYNYDVINKLHSQLWFLPYSNLYTNPDQCMYDKRLTRDETGYEDDDNDDDNKNNGLPNIEPLTRGLVLNLLNIPFYRDNFCFLVVHNQKTFDFYNKKISCKELFTGKQCVHFTESDRKSIKDTIKTFELEAYLQNKSLIILTGSMLRLGISLPCVDLAFNFDNIKSIDLNYQTMFRVLTERENKKYGYYLDFYPERATQFLYQYNEIYGNGFKNSKNMDELVVNLQSLLYLFNYNGISIKQIDEKQTLKLYDVLIEKLQLTKKYYSSRYVKEGNNTIKKILITHTNKELIDKLKQIYVTKEKSDNPNKTKQELKKGKDKERAVFDLYADEEDGDDDEEEEHKEEDEETLNIESISSLLYTFVSLVALFSNEHNYHCNSLVNCFEHIKQELSTLTETQPFCNCNSDYIDVLGCYIKRTQGYTLNNYRKTINIILDILNNPKYNELTNSLIIIFSNIIETIGMKENLIYSMDIKDIQEKITEYLPIKKIEKDKYGEVFTPMVLIEEMFDKLPKEVWSNPDLKWLDPANGIGNFPMVAFMRLNEGLKDVDGFKNEKKRKKHIIKNMLYMVELNEKNVGVSRKIFGKDANIYCGSFLEDGWKEAFGIDKFDVIMGNPPYQKKKPGFKKTEPLWNHFVKKSLSILKENGYLLFVHPSGWRDIKGRFRDVFKLIQDRDLMSLTMRTFKDGAKTFSGAGTNYDYYCLKNIQTKTNKTKVNDIDRNEIEIDLNHFEFIPSGRFEMFKKLRTDSERVNVIYSSNDYETRPEKSKYPISEYKTSEYKYPIINTITQKDGINCMWTNTKNDMFVPKVIWSNGAGTYPIIDKEGKYGLTQFSYAIVDDIDNLKKISNTMNDPDFINLMKYVAFTEHKYNHKIISTFKKDFWDEFNYKTTNSITPQSAGMRSTNKLSRIGKSKKTIKKNPVKSNSKLTKKRIVSWDS